MDLTRFVESNISELFSRSIYECLERLFCVSERHHHWIGKSVVCFPPSHFGVFFSTSKCRSGYVLQKLSFCSMRLSCSSLRFVHLFSKLLIYKSLLLIATVYSAELVESALKVRLSRLSLFHSTICYVLRLQGLTMIEISPIRQKDIYSQESMYVAGGHSPKGRRSGSGDFHRNIRSRSHRQPCLPAPQPLCDWDRIWTGEQCLRTAVQQEHHARAFGHAVEPKNEIERT